MRLGIRIRRKTCTGAFPRFSAGAIKAEAFEKARASVRVNIRRAGHNAARQKRENRRKKIIFAAASVCM